MSKEKLLLGWDTATPTSGLVLMDGCRLVGSVQVRLDRSSAGRAFSVMDSLLEMVQRDEREIKALALVRGPGSFTGIRLAVAVAKGLALSLGIDIYSCTISEAMARLLPLGGRMLAPVINARRGQVYGALFRYGPGGLERITDDMVLDVERWRTLEKRVLFLGPGVDDLGVEGVRHLPSAALGAALMAMDRMSRGEDGEDPEELRPLYIRPSDAEAHLGIKVSPWD